MPTPEPSAQHRRLDEVAHRVRGLLRTSIALVSTFEGGRHYFVGAAGLPPELDRAREIPMIESFCTYVHEGGSQLVVDDVRHETRVAAHPLIGELGIRAYAGWQITDDEGLVVGVLSVMDDQPRAWTAAELTVLVEQADACGPDVRALVSGRP